MPVTFKIIASQQLPVLAFHYNVRYELQHAKSYPVDPRLNYPFNHFVTTFTNS
jgi:hypothetical protein